MRRTSHLLARSQPRILEFPVHSPGRPRPLGLTPTRAVTSVCPEWCRRVGRRRTGALQISSDELRNCATVIAAPVALLDFIVNTWSQNRNRRIENISRFNQVHQRLFADNGYLTRNLAAIETGTMQRDLNDAESQARFHLMLLEDERLAVLANNMAVPRSTQDYLFGSHSPTLRKLMTDVERVGMFRELARKYPGGIAGDAERYKKLTRSERVQFWR